MQKSSAHYQREYRRRLRDQGLVKKEVWVRPEHSKRLLGLEKKLRLTAAEWIPDADHLMLSDHLVWTTPSLFQALQGSVLLAKGIADIELIEGIEPVIHLCMKEYGDLPLFVTVSGEQILVECLLWPKSEVNDINDFNEAVLKTHKYYPLSTISLEPTIDGEDCYFMFGALSFQSVLKSVVIEIETLAINVIQATQAYSEFLITHAEDETAS